MGTSSPGAVATITAAGSASRSTTSSSTVSALVTADGIARVNTAILTVTATITATANSTHSSGASLTITAARTADGYSDKLPAAGLLWMHDGTSYRPRRAWKYDANGVLKPVTFNRAVDYRQGTYGAGLYGAGLYSR